MEEERSKRFKDHLQWQKSLLPLMSRTIIILSIFFFLASLAQLIYLHQTIANSPKINVQSAFTSLNVSSRKSSLTRGPMCKSVSCTNTFPFRCWGRLARGKSRRTNSTQCGSHFQVYAPTATQVAAALSAVRFRNCRRVTALVDTPQRKSFKTN